MTDPIQQRVRTAVQAAVDKKAFDLAQETAIDADVASCVMCRHAS